MAVAALPRPAKPGSQKQSARSASWRIAQQISQEPFEVIKKAGEQMAGQQIQEQGQEQKQIKGEQGSQESALEKRRHSVLQALRTELQEIDELAKKRQEEMRARWRDQEELKKQREEEAKKTKKPLLEPVARVKRGILGGMQKIGLKRKQRQVEMAKTPSN